MSNPTHPSEEQLRERASVYTIALTRLIEDLESVREAQEAVREDLGNLSAPGSDVDILRRVTRLSDTLLRAGDACRQAVDALESANAALDRTGPVVSDLRRAGPGLAPVLRSIQDFHAQLREARPDLSEERAATILAAMERLAEVRPLTRRGAVSYSEGFAALVAADPLLERLLEQH